MEKKNYLVSITALVVFCIILVAGLVIFFYPVNARMTCDLGRWEELPNNLVWGGRIRMAPDHANCTIEYRGNALLFLRLLGRS